MDAERRIIKARISLLFDSPFFGDLAMHLKIQKSDSVPAMGVTPYGDMYYNPKFIDTVNDDELKFVIAHEVLHCSTGQMIRKGYRDQLLWNLAMDFTTNIILRDACIGKVPQGALLDDSFRNMITEEVYNEIYKNTKKILIQSIDKGKGKGKGKGKDKDGGNGVDGVDGTDSGDSKDSGDGKGSKTLDEHIYKPMKPGEGKDIEQEWKQRVASAATVARGRGNLPGNIEMLIEELLRPMVEWRVLLEQFMSRCSRNDYVWSKPSRRHIDNGTYLPSITGESIEICVAIDTSGSISDEEIKIFLSEVNAILNLNSSILMHLYQCDTAMIYKEYRSGDKLEARVTGRGGTSFKPVFEDIEKRGISPACLCYLTDGDGSYPEKEPAYPVLWILIRNWNVPFGEKILMNINGERT